MYRSISLNNGFLLAVLIIASRVDASSKLSEARYCSIHGNVGVPWDYHESLHKIPTHDSCWNTTSNEPVIQICNPDDMDSLWIPSDTNFECGIHEQQNKFCPEDLFEIQLDNKSEYICAKISESRHGFDENFCNGFDTLIDRDNLKKIEIDYLIMNLRQKNISSFWLPIRRDSEFNPFTIRLPGVHYGEIYDMPLEISDLLSDKYCLAATITIADDRNRNLNLTRITSRCDDSHHSVCLLRKDFVAYSGCPQNFGALSYRPYECYGIDWEAGLFPDVVLPVPLAQYFENINRIKFILNKFQSNDKGFFLVKTIHNGKRNLTVEFNLNTNQMRISPFKDKKTLHNLSIEMLTDRKNVELTLKMDNDFKTLILTVYNRNYIWRVEEDGGKHNNFGIKCFTNSNYDRIVKIKNIWENDLETQTMFKLKIYDSGYYWCEAHTIFNFTKVTTSKVYVSNGMKQSTTFAITFDMSCNGYPINLCIGTKLKSLSGIIKKKLVELKKRDKKFNVLNIHNVYIAGIVSISNDQSKIKYLCHVAVSHELHPLSDNSDDSHEVTDSGEDISSSIPRHIGTPMILQGLLIDLVLFNDLFTAKSIKHTEYCFPESFQIGSDLIDQWSWAKIGETATSLKLCLQENGLPIKRRCKGDHINGAYWEKIDTSKIECVKDDDQSEFITRKLYDLSNDRITQKSPKNVTNDVKNLLETKIENIIPADFYYIGKIMKSVIGKLIPSADAKKKYSNASLHDKNIYNDEDSEIVTNDIITIYNSIMEINDDIIKASTVLNSTNILLEAFENLVDGIGLSMQSSTATATVPGDVTASTQFDNINNFIEENAHGNVETIDYNDVGVLLKIAGNFLIFILDPSVANVSGVALFKSEAQSNEKVFELGSLHGAFRNEYYRFILANETVDDLMYEEHLQLATYLPESLWRRLDEITNLSNVTVTKRPGVRVVIKIYSNDKLFKGGNDSVEQKIHKRVVSISIPGHDRNLPEMFPLILRIDQEFENNDTDDNFCSYWNYKSWATDGVFRLAASPIDDEVILCGSTHLTPFAYLLGNGIYNFTVEPEVEFKIRVHKQALDIITLLGCSLSLFGIVGIFLTAAIFQSWRKKASSKVLLQLSTAIAFQMLLFCFVNTEENSQRLIENQIYSSCIAIGACLHYSVLVQFCWMIIIAYLQFKRYVHVFGSTRPHRFIAKSTIFGWGLPLVPVLAVLLFDRESYIPGGDSNKSSICYPTGYSLYFAIVLPVSLVIIANMIIFVIVIYSILRGPDGSIRHTEKRLVISQIRLSVLLFFLLGFTWIFGILAAMKAGLIFSYLFCLTATLQGFVLFFYFIILDPVTRRLWSTYFYRIFGIRKTSYNNSSTSMKETTQTS